MQVHRALRREFDPRRPRLAAGEMATIEQPALHHHDAAAGGITCAEAAPRPRRSSGGELRRLERHRRRGMAGDHAHVAVGAPAPLATATRPSEVQHCEIEPFIVVGTTDTVTDTLSPYRRSHAHALSPFQSLLTRCRRVLRVTVICRIHEDRRESS